MRKISGMYKPRAEINVLLLGVDRAVEVKCRSAGFRQLYGWLIDRDVLIVKADTRTRWSLSLAAQIAKRTASMLMLDGSNPRGRECCLPARPHRSR